VQVLSQDEKTVHGQFLFVQANRLEASGDTIVTFRETAEGTAPAVHYWYYPGETIGKEFIYPKDQALKIAARTHSTVLSVDGEVGPNAQVSSVDESGKVTPWQREAAAAPVNQDASVPAQPTAAAGSLAGNRQPVRETTIDNDVARDTSVGTSGQAAASSQTTTSSQPTTTAPVNEGRIAASELPRTASPLPISGLLGLLSLAGGLGLRAFRR
jgi:hypothetical protein